MNDKFQELYKYLSENNLTDLDSKSFYEKYSGGDSFNELYGYLTSEGMTDLDASSFQSEYFGKKKDEAISEDLSTPQERPTQPSVESGQEFELPTQPQPLESEATSVSPIATPEQIQEGEAILDMQANFFNERRGEDSQKIYTEFLQATNPEKLNYIEQKLNAGDLTEEDKYRLNQEAVSFKMSAIKRNIDRIENQYATNPEAITEEVKSEFKGYVEDLVSSVDEAKEVIKKYPEYHKEVLEKQAAQANKDARYNYYKALFPQAILPATIAEKSAQTLGKFATDILSIPRTISFNSDYGWTDALAEKTSRFIDEAIQNVNAISSSQQQGEILKTVEDEEGNTTTKINPNALLGQSIGVVTEMIPMFVMAGGVTKGLTKLGTATNKASKIGMFSSVMAQTHNNAYEEAIANGASQAEASVAAISTSAAIGAVNLLNPMEKVYSSSKGAKDYVRGLLTGKDKAQNFKDFLRNANFEGLEETIEVPTQAAVNYAMNATMNTNLPTDVSPKEMLTSYVLGSIGGFAYAPLNKSKTPNTRQSLHWSIENQNDFYEGLSSLKGQLVMIDGNEVEITDDFVDEYKKQHESVAKRVKSIRSISPKGDLTEGEKVRLAELVKEKYSVEQYMKEDVDDLVKDKLKQDISDINDEINSIINQETSETLETKEGENTTGGKMVGLMSAEETKTEIDEEAVQEEPVLEGVSNDRNEEQGGQESPELRQESQQEEVTPSKTETITQESGAETTQESSQNVETVPAEEQEVTPKKEKKRPISVLSESEGLTDKQYAKQGVAELVDAINQKSRDKLNAVTESFKSKVDKIKSDFKEFKDRKKAIISFADELTKELSKSGVKKMPTAKVRTAIRLLNTSTTDAALNKASNKLISIYQGIAVTDAEIKEVAAVNKAKTRVKNRSKKAQYGKFSPVINELASIDESQLEPNQRTEYKSLIQEIANKEYSNINEIAKRASELVDSFIPEQSQPLSEEEISDSDTKKQEKIEEAIAEITSSRFQVPSGTELSAEERSILKELNSITKEELDNMPDNHVLNILGAKRDISTGVIQPNAQKAKEQIKRYRAKRPIADATNRADFKSNIKQFFLNPKRFFGSKDKTAVSSAAAHTIDSSLGIKGSAFSRFLAPLNEGFAKVERDVNEARGTLSRLYRNVSWTRDKKRIADTKVFMYAIQKQFEDSPNSNIVHSLEEFYEATLGNQGLRANYDKEVGAKSREIVDDLYSKYSSSGAITSDMIWEDMSKEEKRLYEIMRAELDKNAERVYKIKSLDRSEMFNAISSYFSYPVIGYVAVDLDSVLEGGSFASFLSTKAGTTKERVTYANPVHFSASKSFLTSVQDVARDYHLGEALRVENGALKDYKAEFANSDIAQFTNDIADAINEQRRLLIVGSRVGSLSRIANEIQAATYKYLLGSLRRGFTEIATNTIRILNRAILNWDFKIVPSTLKFMLPSKYTATENEAIKVIAPSGMNRYIEGSTTAGYGDVYINMGENADLDFSDRGIEKRIGSGLKTLTWFNSKVAEFGLGKADRLFAKGMYMSELSKNFKKITGEEIDIEAIANQDTQYLEENGEAIAEASRIANDEVGDWFSTTNKAERPLKQLQATQSNSPFARLRYFMLNFLLNEGQALQKAIINKGAVGAIQKGIPIIVGMASYQALMEASSIAFAKLLKLGFDDEEDDEEDRLIMDAIAEDKAIQRGFGSALIELIVARHFNGVARVPLNFFIEKGNEKFGEGVFREEGEEYDPFHSLVYNRMSTTGEIESDQIVSVLAPEFAPIYTGVIDLIESYKEPAEPKSVNAFIRQIMNEDKKEYYKTKAWLTTGAAVGIIPRDIRDSYVYYRNRELIINGEKEMGKRK